MNRPIERYQGALLGLASGDAVGTTLEFRGRGSFTPIRDMEGGGPFGLEAGQWTDDTSMALCLATSLLDSGGFDAHDQMERYCRWRRDGYLSSTGRCFDIGNTTRRALDNFERTSDHFSGSTDPSSAGNGSIMRLAPVPMYYYPDLREAVHYGGESSRTTHGAAECVDACKLFSGMLVKAFSGADKEEILDGDPFAGMEVSLAPRIAVIAGGAYREKTRDEIKGSGYVVESLEAALWCFRMTESFEEAILEAANLGDDADTTAAVCGQIAGAYYRVDGIPTRWLTRLVRRDEIRHLADRLCYQIDGRNDDLNAT